MTRGELKNIIMECINEMNILESTNYINKQSETGHKTSASIEGINVSVNSDEKDESVLQYIDRDLPKVKKEYKNFKNDTFKEWLKISEKRI